MKDRVGWRSIRHSTNSTGNGQADQSDLYRQYTQLHQLHHCCLRGSFSLLTQLPRCAKKSDRVYIEKRPQPAGTLCRCCDRCEAKDCVWPSTMSASQLYSIYMTHPRWPPVVDHRDPHSQSRWVELCGSACTHHPHHHPLSPLTSRRIHWKFAKPPSACGRRASRFASLLHADRWPLIVSVASLRQGRWNYPGWSTFTSISFLCAWIGKTRD